MAPRLSSWTVAAGLGRGEQVTAVRRGPGGPAAQPALTVQIRTFCRAGALIHRSCRRSRKSSAAQPNGTGSQKVSSRNSRTALTAGLTAAGVPGAVAVSAVLLFRLLTFWLPVPFGSAALHFLEQQQDL